jgi:hypothetical protein
VRPKIDLFSSSTQESSIENNLEILKRAASDKTEDPDSVYTALVDLEKQMRALAKDDPSVAEDMLKALNADWRLVFTTGTANTQKKLGARINYFPLKAVQSFRTQESSMTIENGIYGPWDIPVIKFSGFMDFDLKKRKLEFDFNKVLLFGVFDITLKQGEAAKIGSSTGLGSESNVENANRGKRPFFNWISADDWIATARGGGGGLALWKRVLPEE